MPSSSLRHLHQTSDPLFQVSARERVVEAVVRFTQLLNRLGYPARAYSEAALEKLADTSLEKKRQMASDFESWSSWIEPLDPRSSFEVELELLRRALDKHGFEADGEFWKKIEKDQIIEFYDEDMIQLYRSFNFYKITGYSVLDISLFEWFVLWERPRRAVESIGAELSESLERHIPVKPFATKKHLVREIFNASRSKNFTPRASILEPIRLGSLVPKERAAHQKKGFICTSTGETIAIGKEAESIQFI